jgi:hypothetical protein
LQTSDFSAGRAARLLHALARGVGHIVHVDPALEVGFAAEGETGED